MMGWMTSTHCRWTSTRTRLFTATNWVLVSPVCPRSRAVRRPTDWTLPCSGDPIKASRGFRDAGRTNTVPPTSCLRRSYGTPGVPCLRRPLPAAPHQHAGGLRAQHAVSLAPCLRHPPRGSHTARATRCPWRQHCVCGTHAVPAVPTPCLRTHRACGAATWLRYLHRACSAYTVFAASQSCRPDHQVQELGEWMGVIHTDWWRRWRCDVIYIYSSIGVVVPIQFLPAVAVGCMQRLMLSCL
jgi:hypothetical protein